jgi:hypothetical protein
MILRADELDQKNILEIISEEQLLLCVRSDSCHTTKYNIFSTSVFL